MKAIKIALLMDDIATIKPEKDSSFAMMLEATRRGWEVYTFDTHDIFTENAKPCASCAKTQVFDRKQNYYNRATNITLALSEFAVILIRKDPPFNMNYIYTTYFLEQAEKDGVLVVNKPQSLRDANEKLFALNFPHCIPKTLVSANPEKIKAFINTQKTAVVKPLDGMGGDNVFKLKSTANNTTKVLDYLTKNATQPIMAQQFLAEITKGDKRILLINGKPIAYALARIPAAGSFKGNLAAGAVGVGQPLSKRDYFLCAQIAPTLKEKELLFVGLDVIGNYITEINVTSPTCIRELDKQFNLNIAAVLFDVIEEKL